jgi:hypothetical protein
MFVSPALGTTVRMKANSSLCEMRRNVTAPRFFVLNSFQQMVNYFVIGPTLLSV